MKDTPIPTPIPTHTNLPTFGEVENEFHSNRNMKRKFETQNLPGKGQDLAALGVKATSRNNINKPCSFFLCSIRMRRLETSLGKAPRV